MNIKWIGIGFVIGITGALMVCDIPKESPLFAFGMAFIGLGGMIIGAVSGRD